MPVPDKLGTGNLLLACGDSVFMLVGLVAGLC